jgi:hypothetical protein
VSRSEPKTSVHSSVEGQVGGNQDRAALIALAEDVQEQLGSGLGQGHEAQFVDDEELQTRRRPLACPLHRAT